MGRIMASVFIFIDLPGVFLLTCFFVVGSRVEVLHGDDDSQYRHQQEDCSDGKEDGTQPRGDPHFLKACDPRLHIGQDGFGDRASGQKFRCHGKQRYRPDRTSPSVGSGVVR